MRLLLRLSSSAPYCIRGTSDMCSLVEASLLACMPLLEESSSCLHVSRHALTSTELLLPHRHLASNICETSGETDSKLSQQACVNAVDLKGRTALHYASGELVVITLLEVPPHPPSPTRLRTPPAHSLPPSTCDAWLRGERCGRCRQRATLRR